MSQGFKYPHVTEGNDPKTLSDHYESISMFYRHIGEEFNARLFAWKSLSLNKKG